MTRPRLLDLFCGAGGAAMGYHRAGFDVTGVDIEPQPRYPFEFMQADAMTYPLGGFDAIHASPPCQDHMRSPGPAWREHGTGWMLAATRARLTSSAVPWVIENVPGASLRADYKLCGCQFDLRSGDWILLRERLFETSWHGFDLRPPCVHAGKTLTVTGHTGSWTKRRGYLGTLADRREAMGIGWTNRDELAQAIPPAYTEFIGRQLIEHLGEPQA